MENSLSVTQLRDLFASNKEYIVCIYNGVNDTVRRREYMEGGMARENLKVKRYMPFNDSLLDVVMGEISKIWMRNIQEQRDNSNFIWNVILPEILIKVSVW